MPRSEDSPTVGQPPARKARFTVFSNLKFSAFDRFTIVPLVIRASQTTVIDSWISVYALPRDNLLKNWKKYITRGDAPASHVSGIHLPP